MLVLQSGGLLKKGGGNIFDIDTFSLHLLAMCVQKCMKERRGGSGGVEGVEGKEPRRQEGRGSITTTA